MNDIEQSTDTVEEFIMECLNQDMDYEDIFEYLKTNHKG